MTYPFHTSILEMLVLSIIMKEDSYGYRISQQLKEISNLKDSALYPVLRRLSDVGYVSVYDKQFQGRNRKYYHITQTGALYYERLREEWQRYMDNINTIINSERREGNYG